MILKLEFGTGEHPLKANHHDGFILIGSCFSDEIAVHFRKGGFNVVSNSFGTLFHPNAIRDVISSSIDESKAIDVFQSNDVFYSWDASSKLSGQSEKDLLSKVVEERTAFLSFVKQAKYLVITFGTAWGYNHRELNKIVGNCHKAPKDTFDKVLSDVDTMFQDWSSLLIDLKNLNPELNFLFTVSPVRHKKDGLIENNRSKARLIELVQLLVESREDAEYFPSYEVLIDELRDYRFYSKDLVHPNDIAVEYIWEKFSQYMFTPECTQLIERIIKIKTSIDHKSLHPGSLADKERIVMLKKEKNELLALHPEIVW